MTFISWKIRFLTVQEHFLISRKPILESALMQIVFGIFVSILEVDSAYFIVFCLLLLYLIEQMLDEVALSTVSSNKPPTVLSL